MSKIFKNYIVQDFSKCSFVNRKEIIKGKQCGNVSETGTGFCEKCDRREKLDILGESIIANNVIMISKCLSQFNYDNNKIDEILESSIQSWTKSSTIELFLNCTHYHPEVFNYDILFNDKFPIVSQSVLSRFFYKRFLIKSYLLSDQLFENGQFDPVMFDLLPLFLDPFYKIRPPSNVIPSKFINPNSILTLRSTTVILFPKLYMPNFTYDDITNVTALGDGIYTSEIKGYFTFYMHFIDGCAFIFDKRSHDNEEITITDNDKLLIDQCGIGYI